MKYFSPILAAVMITAFSLAMLSPAEASRRADVRRLVVEEAMNSHVPPSLAMAVAKVESDFQPKALSRAGARGVMQIMPATAMGEYGVAADELWNVRLNVQLGIDFLEQLIARYGGRWDLALSHYNGGSVLRTRAGMEPLPATARGDYGVTADLLWQPRINIRLGIHFLRRLIARYHGRVDLALSYYNGGSAVGDLPRAQVIPATRGYVKRVKFLHKRYRKEVWSGGYLKWMHKTPSGMPSRRD